MVECSLIPSARHIRCNAISLQQSRGRSGHYEDLSASCQQDLCHQASPLSLSSAAVHTFSAHFSVKEWWNSFVGQESSWCCPVCFVLSWFHDLQQPYPALYRAAITECGCRLQCCMLDYVNVLLVLPPLHCLTVERSGRPDSCAAQYTINNRRSYLHTSPGPAAQHCTRYNHKTQPTTDHSYWLIQGMRLELRRRCVGQFDSVVPPPTLTHFHFSSTVS